MVFCKIRRVTSGVTTSGHWENPGGHTSRRGECVGFNQENYELHITILSSNMLLTCGASNMVRSPINTGHWILALGSSAHSYHWASHEDYLWWHDAFTVRPVNSFNMWRCGHFIGEYYADHHVEFDIPYFQISGLRLCTLVDLTYGYSSEHDIANIYISIYLYLYIYIIRYSDIGPIYYKVALS